MKSVLSGAAAGIEHGAGECAFGCQAHDGGLWLPDVPGRGPVVVRRIPRPPHPEFFIRRLASREWIVRSGL
jgi:hypothetical protein